MLDPIRWLRNSRPAAAQTVLAIPLAAPRGNLNEPALLGATQAPARTAPPPFSASLASCDGCWLAWGEQLVRGAAWPAMGFWRLAELLVRRAEQFGWRAEFCVRRAECFARVTGLFARRAELGARQMPQDGA